MSLIDAFEKIKCEIKENVYDGSKYVAQKIAKVIKQKQKEGKPCILGLATGSTPKTLYAELVRMHKEEGLSFKNVITFNLDEYYPIEKKAIQSYHNFMHRLLFNQVDIDLKNVHILDGNIKKELIKKHCQEFEALIEKYGGIDLQILGVGINGHIGFNEPGSSLFSKTRMVTLATTTRIANTYEFANISEVPRLAITVGINSILKARQIVLMAWGSSKAPVIVKAVEGDDTEEVPASLLQDHDDVEFVLDKAAATELTRFKSPWLTGDCDWEDPILIKKAVVSLSLKLSKPVLQLTASDYNHNGLGDLLAQNDSKLDKLNLQVYYMLRDSITGWPAGKPNAVIPAHPERMKPYPKRSLIFSPHPDDDIISMGGTFQRLVDQGNEVHVAYQTSGNIAVTDEFVTRFLDFAVGFEQLAGVDTKITNNITKEATKFINQKKKGESDTPTVRKIKGLIRRCEARATCRYVGIPDKNIHFQNLPFYETGTIEKKPASEKDIQITMKLLQQLKPHQIFCAGDFADPHGTHIICYNVVLESLKRLKKLKEAWVKDCWLWLYKGAWQEWDISDIEMAIPMSPDQVLQKRHGIFIHQSQKDMVPFQGSDAREFWQRAEERNANTAKLYADLGLTHYAAMEAFVRMKY